MKISQSILNLVPYKAGKPIQETQRQYALSNVVKLASNENPLGTSPQVQVALQQALQNINRYPDANCQDLLYAIANKWNIEKKFIAVGNGSNELIDILIRTFCEPGDQILTTELAFIAYQICAQAARVQTRFAKLLPSMQTDFAALSEILRQDAEKKIRLVFLPNPNNPTGTYFSEKAMHKFLQEFGRDPDRLIIFDEAYTEFVRAPDYASALSVFNGKDEFSNVVVLRTLSKAYGLAGLRVGILFAPEIVIDYFNRVRNPFNVNEIAQVAAMAALQDQDFVKKTVHNNGLGLDFFYQQLQEIKLPYVESQANFVFFDTQRDMRLVNEALLQKGLILRPLLNYGLPTQLRMSVGLPKENQFAIQTLREVLMQIPQIQEM